MIGPIGNINGREVTADDPELLAIVQKYIQNPAAGTNMLGAVQYMKDNQGFSIFDPRSTVYGNAKAFAGAGTEFGPNGNVVSNGTGSDFANAAKARLNKVGAGENLPYGQSWQDAQLGEQSDMNAAAENQRVSAMRSRAAAGGGSMNDPSLGAGGAEAASKRQTANATAKRGIGQQAQEGNWQAQFAANKLLSGMSPGMFGYGAGAYGASKSTPSATPQTLSYNSAVTAGNAQNAQDDWWNQYDKVDAAVTRTEKAKR